MSYQVLARKWRPRIFREMVGQTHVLQALINALDHNRLHHAYLFTGTRGVGKTSIARILAKCLNCEVGVSSEPCGQCGSCQEIEQGRFVDLIEVDAASRTKVEDTRELLDNVQYAPTRGRFKVYLIDEVHMLSTHSFNALLKTLEEPPPHVKFLLATTDPQKLPVTILSRCLQFNLKNMSPERVVEHLAHVLEQEMISFEKPALWQLGRAADGSMRDALSLTDQAIAYGGGRVNEIEVSAMLGTIDQSQVYGVMKAVMSGDASQCLVAVAQLAGFSPDYSKVLADMLSVMHRMSIAQAIPDAVDNSQGDQDKVVAMAEQITAEDLHLFYQIALIGRKDLSIAPDPRAGFEMVLLRMLAFKPEGTPQPPTEKLMVDAKSPAATTATSSNAAVSNDVESAAQAQLSDANTSTIATEQPTTAEPAAESVTPSKDQASGNSNATPENEVVIEPVGRTTYGEKKPLKKPLATAETSLTPAVHPVPPAPMPELDESPQMMDAYAAEAAYQHYAESATAFNEGLEVGLDTDSDQGSSASVSHDEQRNQAPADVSEGVASSQNVTAEAASVQVRPNQRPTLTVVPNGSSSQVAADKDIQRQAAHEPAINASSQAAVIEPVEKISLEAFTPENWAQGLSQFGLAGVTLSIAAHFEFCSADTKRVTLRVAKGNSTLLNATHEGRIEKALQEYFQCPLKLTVEQQATVAETPAQYQARRAAERLATARQAIAEDGNVKALVAQFSATIVEDSIQPK